jgi:hypothetical protein
MEMIHPHDGLSIISMLHLLPSQGCSVPSHTLVVFRGAPPWVRDSDGSLMANPSFMTFPSDSPRPYVSLAMWCLNKDPKARPTFAQVLHIVRVSAVRASMTQGFECKSHIERVVSSVQPPLLPIYVSAPAACEQSMKQCYSEGWDRLERPYPSPALSGRIQEAGVMSFQCVRYCCRWISLSYAWLLTFLLP